MMILIGSMGGFKTAGGLGRAQPRDAFCVGGVDGPRGSKGNSDDSYEDRDPEHYEPCDR